MANLFVWLYNSNTGVVYELPSYMAAAELSSGLGWHGPFNTHDDAITYYNNNAAKNPGWKAPVGATDIGAQLGNAGTSAGQAAVKVATQDTFKGLNLQTWFIRIGEILLGVILIGVGLAKLTGTSNVISSLAKVPIPV